MSAAAAAGSFRHILVATDGSPRSVHAVRVAAELARAQHARLTVFNARALDLVHYPPWKGQAAPSPQETHYREILRRESDAVLAAATSAATNAGVACETASIDSDEPWRAIVATATGLGCDLIVMASHGRHGIDAVVLGSETLKVLGHSSIPVMVTHDTDPMTAA